MFLVQSGGARLHHYWNVPTYTGPATITMGLGELYLTLRLLSYIYGVPILDVSRSYTTTHQSVGLLWTSDQLVAETST